VRSYDEYCAVAKSLDLVGDRWTLLVIRELLQRGAARYTDLRNGLPGIASNLLADRLRDLEAAGLLTREEAPPPVATTLFRLTPRGEALRPALDELMRWGLPLMVEQKPEDAVRSHWLAGAVEVMVSDRDPKGDPVTLELRIADEPVVIAARDGETKVTLGAASDPDAVLVGPERPILGLLFGILDQGAAEAMGVALEGDPTVVERFAADAAPGA
jgi:DNA-binding HxlR family transcriptional regulator